MLPAARLPCPFWFASIAHRIGAGPGSGPFAPLLSCSTAYTLSRRSPAAPACQLFYGIGGQLPILLEQSKSRQRLPGGLADILIRILQAVVQRLNDPASQVAVLKPLRDLAQDLRGRPADIRVHIPERFDKGIHHPRGWWMPLSRRSGMWTRMSAGLPRRSWARSRSGLRTATCDA